MTSMAFDLDLIFPIRDVASADLMMLKATCLWNARIIDDRQRKLVQQRAARFSAGETQSLLEIPGLPECLSNSRICPARCRPQVTPHGKQKTL
jgi:hypothetical protein